MSKDFSIAICDDNEYDIKQLEIKIGKILGKMKVDFTVDTFSSGQELLKRYRFGEKYGLIIMDIYMVGLNGIETLKKIREVDEDITMAVVSSSREFALEAIDMDAVHYLVKPVDDVKLEEMFARLFRRIDKPERFLELEVGGFLRRFPLKKLRRISSYNKGVNLQLNKWREEVWLPCTFTAVAESLSRFDDFVLISRGCMVNMDMIQEIDFDICRMKDGEELSVSRRERTHVKRQYADYLFRKLEVDFL